MSDLFLDLLSTPAWQLGLILLAGYFFVAGGLRWFLKPALVSGLDPLNVSLLTTFGIGIAGLLGSPLLFHAVTPSYKAIVLFLAILFCIIRFAGKPRIVNLRDRLDIDFQHILLALCVGITLTNIVVNMILPGKIPLLMENGSGARFEATENSRLLTWMVLGVTPLGGMLYALTENEKVRRYALYVAFLQMAQNILAASKAGILTMIFVLLNAAFVAQQRREAERYLYLRKWLRRTVIAVSVLLPFYLVVIGIGSGGSTTGTLAARLLGGFDQLILTSQFDLLHHGSNRFGVNLLEYQFMPVVKVVLQRKYLYSSIGQYVIEAATGTYIEGPFTLPNSNLILEAIMTSGMYLGFFFYILELGLFYWLRRVCLRRSVTPVTFVLLVATVFNPLGLFLSGQEWFIETLLSAMIIALALLLAQVWKALRRVSAIYDPHSRIAQL